MAFFFFPSSEITHSGTLEKYMKQNIVILLSIYEHNQRSTLDGQELCGRILCF